MRDSKVHRRWARGIGLTVALGTLGLPSLARAEGPSTGECITAAEASVKLRNEQHLREARRQLLICAAVSCPTDVRVECANKVEQVNASMPTIVFEPRNAAGDELSEVKVSMDGQPLGSRLDGSAIPVDPGSHRFVFEAAGQPDVVKTLVLHEGEKTRHERVVFGDVTSAARPAVPVPVRGPASSDPSTSDLSTGELTVGDGGRAHRTAGIVVGVGGLALLGVGTAFGLVASSKWSDSKDACTSSTNCANHAQAVSDHDSAGTSATISTLAFIIGGAAVATGVVLYLTAPRHEHSIMALHLAPRFEPGGAGLTLAGSL